MASIICSVVDFEYLGLTGMHVSLLCSCTSTGNQDSFEACTDADGRIMKWEPSVASGTATHNTGVTVNTSQYSEVQLIFATGQYFGQDRTPWATVRAHLDAIKLIQSVTLQFGPYNATYSLRCVTAPMRCFGKDFWEQPSRTHCAASLCPPQTASPTIKLRDSSLESATEGPSDLVFPVLDAVPRKRKAEYHHRDEPPRKKRLIMWDN
ncbi:hypothetical protein PG991_008939 [Apiospora marii]|uniref:Uncharacterized protein n=2 Tax=Apiospora marii TaxID=335849 RepID=A0ABR1RJB7_9PEZI